jgi:hypothetical protein
MKLARCAICFVLIGPITVTASVGQTATPPIQPTQSEKRSAPTIASASSVHTSDDVDVLRETQLTITMPHHSGLIWWIPFEFWALSAEKNGNSPEKVRDGLKALRDYTIVGVVAAKVSTLGTFDYTTPNDLQKYVFIRDSEGQDYSALADLTGDAKTLAETLKPVLASALGRAGENFALLFFPAMKKGGKRIADEMSKGSFSVVLKEITGEPETVYLWRTPLTSVTPPRYCPVGGERVHADWDYCPRHGVKLDKP